MRAIEKTIVWKDDESTEKVLFGILDGKTGDIPEAIDDQIFFYVQNLTELNKLCNAKSGEDFYILSEHDYQDLVGKTIVWNNYQYDEHHVLRHIGTYPYKVTKVYQDEVIADWIDVEILHADGEPDLLYFEKAELDTLLDGETFKRYREDGIYSLA